MFPTSNQNSNNMFSTTTNTQVPECMSLLQNKRREMMMSIAKEKRDNKIAKLRELMYQAEINQNSEKSTSTDGSEGPEEESKLDNENQAIQFFENISFENKIISNNPSEENPNCASYYRRQFAHHDYFLTIPENLGDAWMILAKPKGHRVLVTTGGGKSIARDVRGHKCKKFKSLLPGGSSATQDGKLCILDCVWDKMNEIFYIMDVLIWEKNVYTEFSALERQNKIDEILKIPGLMENSNDNTCIFRTPVKYNCDVAGLIEAYGGNTNYLKDGLYFILKEGTYILGNNPLMLWWKDKTTSSSSETQNKTYILKVNEFQQLVTREGKLVWVLSEEEAIKLKPKSHIKVNIEEIQLLDGQESIEGMFNFTNVKFVEVVKYKSRVDKISKIMLDYFGALVNVPFEKILRTLKEKK